MIYESHNITVSIGCAGQLRFQLAAEAANGSVATTKSMSVENKNVRCHKCKQPLPADPGRWSVDQTLTKIAVPALAHTSSYATATRRRGCNP